MGVAADKFFEALSKRGPDIYVDTKKVVKEIMQEAPREKRSFYAHDLLRAGMKQAQKRGDGCIMLNIIPAIAKGCPEDKNVIDMCAKAAQDLGDRGLQAAVRLIADPNDKSAVMDMMVAMTAKSREFPNMNGMDKPANQWHYLDTPSGTDHILELIKQFSNDKGIANRACQIMHNFGRISDSVRTYWTCTIVDANPGNPQVTEMAFAQNNKFNWWRGNLSILSSIARANKDNPAVLREIRENAESMTSSYPEVQATYRSQLLVLTEPLEKKDVCDRLINMTYGAWNEAKINVYNDILEAHPNDEAIAMKILRDPFRADIAGDKNAGYTVSTVFSKVLEVNPNNQKLLDFAVQRALEIKANPNSQGLYMFDEAIAKWTGKELDPNAPKKHAHWQRD